MNLKRLKTPPKIAVRVWAVATAGVSLYVL